MVIKCEVKIICFQKETPYIEIIGICLITKDVPALAKFYSQVLGVVAEGNETHVELKTEGD